jgi:signal transduction histidine kinase
MFFKKCRPSWLVGVFLLFVSMDTGFCQQTVADSQESSLWSAFVELIKYHQIPDSQINVGGNDPVSFHNIGFKAEDSRRENEHLESLNATSRRVINQQRLILGIVSSAFLIAIFAWFRVRKLFRKVKMMNQQIALQNDELAELNGIKTKVFSVIAHDLRNPLIQLTAVMQLIENDVIGPDEFGTLIPSLNRSVYQTLHITDNLLMWAKSQMNGYKVRPEAINLDQLSKEVVESLSVQLEAKRLHIDISTLHRLPAWADVEMVRIVVRNLLTNAIKFTPPGGSIRLGMGVDRDLMRLEITDSGVGMTAEQLQHLFSFDTKCTRGTENERGSGLGLKICADLLKINNGEICVKSELGQGTTFFVGLPRSANSPVVLPVTDHVFVGVAHM